MRALLQGNLIVGTAKGGTAGLPAGVQPGQDYDIFAGSAIGYVELDLGVVRPFVLGVYGSPDGDPRDRQLRGFAMCSPRATRRNGPRICWATSIGVRRRGGGGTIRVRRGCAGCGRRSAREQPLCHWHGCHGRRVVVPRVRPLRECYHSVSNLWNARLGRASHGGIVITYSNPGTLVGSVGVRTFPLKGHEITGWFTYRAMANNNLLEAAFAPEIQAGVIRQIRKALYYEVGGFWMWTLNPHFDIRLAGNVAMAADGSRDLAHLADCDPGPARRTCEGETLALRGEARFRARF